MLMLAKKNDGQSGKTDVSKFSPLKNVVDNRI